MCRSPYDFSTATAGSSLNGNDNWTRLATNSGSNSAQVINTGQPTGFSGDFLNTSLVTYGDFQWARPNDSNFSYSITGDATQLQLSFLVETESGRSNRLGLRNTVNGDLFRFGQSSSDWWVRGTDGVSHAFGSGSGDGQLTGTRKSFKVMVDINLTDNTLDFLVDDLDTATGAETIKANFSVAGILGDVTSYNALYLRASAGNSSSYEGYLDDFTITTVIPEPASLALLGTALLGLLCRRRRRS